MAVRKPIVLGADGLPQQLQSADSTGTHARFTGTITPPVLSAFTAAPVPVNNLTPAVTGDSLAVGETVTLHINAGSSLPNTMVVSYEPQVTATNTVSVKLLALVALSAGTAVPVTILAHR